MYIVRFAQNRIYNIKILYHFKMQFQYFPKRFNRHSQIFSRIQSVNTLNLHTYSGRIIVRKSLIWLVIRVEFVWIANQHMCVFNSILSQIINQNFTYSPADKSIADNYCHVLSFRNESRFMFSFLCLDHTYLRTHTNPLRSLRFMFANFMRI